VALEFNATDDEQLSKLAVDRDNNPNRRGRVPVQCLRHRQDS
jgi:hypothetical protein